MAACGHFNQYGYQALQVAGGGILPDESKARVAVAAGALHLNAHEHDCQGKGIKPDQMAQGVALGSAMQRLHYQHYQLQGAT